MVIEKITISVDSKEINDTVVNDLNTLFVESPGQTQVFIQIKYDESHTTVTLRSKDVTVTVGKTIVNYLESNSALNFRIN